MSNIPLGEMSMPTSTKAVDDSSSLQRLPMRLTQHEDNDTDSYSNDDFASNNEASSIHEFKSMPNIPLGEKSVPATMKSQDASESDDAYSTDDDFVTSFKDESSDEDHSSSTHHIEGQSICDEPSTVMQPHSQILGNISRSCHVERPGSREAQHRRLEVKGSSDASTQSTQMKSEPDSDAGYIGEVQYIPNECASTTHLPVVQDMIQQSSPMNETPRIAYSQHQCRVSFDPICVLIAAKAPEGRPSAPDKSQNGLQRSKQRLNELSQPIKHKIFNTPEKSGKPNKKSPKVSTDGPSFLKRMTTMENEKREKLQRAAAEATYTAKVDKVHFK